MSATVPKIGWPRKNFFLLLVLPTHLPKLKARLYWRVWGHNLQNRKGISVVLHWQNLLEISLEIARNLPSGVLRKVIQAEGVLPAVNSMKLPRKSWKPIGCCVLLTTVHCMSQGSCKATRTMKAAPFLLQWDCARTLHWQNLTLCQQKKEKHLKGSPQFFQSSLWKVNMELKGNKLMSGMPN